MLLRWLRSASGCVLPRASHHYKTIKSRPPVAPRNLAKLPQHASYETDQTPAEALAVDAGEVAAQDRARRRLARDQQDVDAGEAEGDLVDDRAVLVGGGIDDDAHARRLTGTGGLWPEPGHGALHVAGRRVGRVSAPACSDGLGFSITDWPADGGFRFKSPARTRIPKACPSGGVSACAAGRGTRPRTSTKITRIATTRITNALPLASARLASRYATQFVAGARARCLELTLAASGGKLRIGLKS